MFSRPGCLLMQRRVTPKTPPETETPRREFVKENCVSRGTGPRKSSFAQRCLGPRRNPVMEAGLLAACLVSGPRPPRDGSSTEAREGGEGLQGAFVCPWGGLPWAVTHSAIPASPRAVWHHADVPSRTHTHTQTRTHGRALLPCNAHVLALAPTHTHTQTPD